jgi:hypothetical protein
MKLFIYLSVYSFIYLRIYLSIYIFIYLSIYLFIENLCKHTESFSEVPLLLTPRRTRYVN